MEAIGIVIGVIALFVLGLMVLLAVSAVKAGRAVSRKVEEHGAQARRAVEDVTLKARSFTRPGPQGRIAALRLEVRSSLAGTRQVLESGIGDDPQLGDALRLLVQLEGHGRELDGKLRQLEREPGTQRVEAVLPGLREHAERLTHAAEALRWAALDRAHRFSDDELGRLSQECQAEANALRHWAPTQAPAATDPGAADSGAAERRNQHSPSGPRARQDGRPALADGQRSMDAEQMLGLGKPRQFLSDRLRKPRPKSGPTGAG
jgi:hypothetical protein